MGVARCAWPRLVRGSRSGCCTAPNGIVSGLVRNLHDHAIDSIRGDAPRPKLYVASWRIGGRKKRSNFAILTVFCAAGAPVLAANPCWSRRSAGKIMAEDQALAQVRGQGWLPLFEMYAHERIFIHHTRAAHPHGSPTICGRCGWTPITWTTLRRTSDCPTSALEWLGVLLTA